MYPGCHQTCWLLTMTDVMAGQGVKLLASLQKPPSHLLPHRASQGEPDLPFIFLSSLQGKQRTQHHVTCLYWRWRPWGGGGGRGKTLSSVFLCLLGVWLKRQGPKLFGQFPSPAFSALPSTSGPSLITPHLHLQQAFPEGTISRSDQHMTRCPLWWSKYSESIFALKKWEFQFWLCGLLTEQFWSIA
jgi:hypothetical protein